MVIKVSSIFDHVKKIELIKELLEKETTLQCENFYFFEKARNCCAGTFATLVEIITDEPVFGNDIPKIKTIIRQLFPSEKVLFLTFTAEGTYKNPY